MGPVGEVIVVDRAGDTFDAAPTPAEPAPPPWPLAPTFTPDPRPRDSIGADSPALDGGVGDWLATEEFRATD
jgi:hypothetical protein